jgi:hypothetical protein
MQTASQQTLLGNSWWPNFNAMGLRMTRGVFAVSLTLKRRRQDRCSARFCITQQSRVVAMCVRHRGKG